MYLAAWFCDPCLRHIPITTFVLSTPPGILCTRIPLCHKFRELVDCIKTKLKIVTSMQFKLCTASWLEWGGGALSTKVFTGVCRKHGLQNQDGQVCRVPFLCKIWYQKLQNLYQKSINVHKNCDICIESKFERLVYGWVPSLWVVPKFHAVHPCPDQSWVAKPTHHAIKLFTN